MPELPEVEIFRKYLNRTSLNRRIQSVNIYANEMLKEVSSLSLQKNLKNSRFIKTNRHAKYLFAYTDHHKILVLHFGMTGSLKYYRNDEAKPGHIRMVINFSNGYHLAYDCTRKLGKIFLINDEQKFVAKKNLGPDPFSDKFTLPKFREMLSDKKGTIKSALMDQSAVSGIGNIYSDEILFNSNIHPASKTELLNDDQIKKIYQMIKKVLNKSIEAGTDIQKMPVKYLLMNRMEGNNCLRCPGKIRKKTIGGRSSYFCDRHQKEISE